MFYIKAIRAMSGGTRVRDIEHCGSCQYWVMSSIIDSDILSLGGDQCPKWL